VLDDETIERLLNTCAEIWCGQSVDATTRSNERRRINELLHSIPSLWSGTYRGVGYGGWFLTNWQANWACVNSN